MNSIKFLIEQSNNGNWKKKCWRLPDDDDDDDDEWLFVRSVLRTLD